MDSTDIIQGVTYSQVVMHLECSNGIHFEESRDLAQGSSNLRRAIKTSLMENKGNFEVLIKSII